MAEGFDPYYTWLGIPPDEQPPTHYRLLGLRAFEDHVEAIQNAADRQMTYLRTFQTGPHSHLSQRLLNEVAAARVCLANPERKAAYDAMLWQRMQPSPAPAVPAPPSQAERALNDLFESLQPPPSRNATVTHLRGYSRQVRQNLWLLSGLACVVVALLVWLWLWRPAMNVPKLPSKSEETVLLKEGQPKTALPSSRLVPNEAAQTQALTLVKQRFAKEYEASQRYVRLGLAARLIRQARESRQPAEQYVLLCEARGLAERQGDAALALLAIDELAKRFEVSGGEMRREALSLALRQSQTPASLALIAESAFQAAEASLADGEYPAWSTLLGQLKDAASKKGDSPLAQSMDEQQRRLETLQGVYQGANAAAKALEQTPGDPAANLELGRFYCLAKGDWDKGLPLLAKASQGPLPPLAAKLAAGRDDAGTQLALADAWWGLADKDQGGMKPLLTTAANYWYEQALPRLTGDELARVEERLTGDASTGREMQAKAPFRVSLHGLGGLPAMTPNRVLGNIVPAEGFAVLQGKCRLEYAQIPASAFVHQVELTFTNPSGGLTIFYGDLNEGAKLSLWWDDAKKKVMCRLFCYRGNWFFWGGTRTYNPPARLRFTVYVNESRHSLYEGDRGAMGCGGHPADLYLRIHTEGKAAVTFHRCEFRRFTSVDAQRLRWPMPPSKIEANWGETAIRLYEQNIELRDRPLLADKKPYVVASTGTAMQWVEPGSYQRPVGKDGKQSYEIAVSRGFWIGRYELTQGQWSSLMPVNPSRVTGSPFLPVDSMAREDAVKFCQLLTQQEATEGRLPNGYVYRLPTEGEWEYACRSGSKEDFSVAPADFWCAENSGWRSHEVGEGRPNAWGLYDMHGNLGEWCLDAWRSEPNASVGRETDPFTPPPTKTSLFPVHGGSWWDGRNACKSQAREACLSVAGGYRGFRLVLGPAVVGFDGQKR